MKLKELKQFVVVLFLFKINEKGDRGK